MEIYDSTGFLISVGVLSAKNAVREIRPVNENLQSIEFFFFERNTEISKVSFCSGLFSHPPLTISYLSDYPFYSIPQYNEQF